MKKNRNLSHAGFFIILMLFVTPLLKAQGEKTFIKKYLSQLPSDKPVNTLTKYRMSAVYTNRDLYGRFTGKTSVTGDYTRGLPGDTVKWNNVFIASSQKFDEPFTQGTKKDYMENFKYVPSGKMIQESAFKTFPSDPENIFARNLVWDMYTFETFALNYYDSLKLNVPFILPDMKGQFDMADIGKYAHNKIVLCWQGITIIKGEICAVIDFDAIDNLLELTLPQLRSKGTEQYWGTVQLSLKTKNIEHAVMYSGTIQELEITGMKDKLIVKTVREIEVNKIQ